MAQYRVTLTVDTADLRPGAWPEVSVEVESAVSIRPENPEEEEIIGRIVSMRYERMEEDARQAYPLEGTAPVGAPPLTPPVRHTEAEDNMSREIKAFGDMLAAALVGSTVMFFLRLWSPPFMFRDVLALVSVWCTSALLMAPLFALWLVVKKHYGLRW